MNFVIYLTLVYKIVSASVKVCIEIVQIVCELIHSLFDLTMSIERLVRLSLHLQLVPKFQPIMSVSLSHCDECCKRTALLLM